MTTVYVAIRSGVYRHGIVGVFTDLELAKSAACASVESEHDHYHDVDIVACDLDGLGERSIGSVSAKYEQVPVFGPRSPRDFTVSRCARIYVGTEWIPD